MSALCHQLEQDHSLTHPSGVGAPCQSNDGNKTPQFTPQFPGTCPYITAVGGTQSISPEIAWVAGSGGFSNYFTRPDYQAGAVTTYLNDQISAATKEYFSAFANFANRGFPDVSAHSLTPEYVLCACSLSPLLPLATNEVSVCIASLNIVLYSYAVVVNAQAGLSGGTSAAVPVFSSVIALLNDARFRAGKPALGFLNPWRTYPL